MEKTLCYQKPVSENDLPAEAFVSDPYIDLPMDWDDDNQLSLASAEDTLPSVSDVLVLSILRYGRVDIDFIAQTSGSSSRMVIERLGNSIFQNPETWNEDPFRGWETAEEYLSGNLIRKWKAAKAANRKYHGRFASNLRAIENVLPSSAASREIYITLGSPWVPADIIDAFINHILKTNRYWRFCGTKHDVITGTWEVPNKSDYSRGSFHAMHTYGTSRISALHLIEKTLNMRSIAVKDEVSCPTSKSGSKWVINKEETVAAIEKQKKLIREFQNWVWADPRRKERLEKIFEESFSCVRRRIFDGSFLEFPGMSSDIRLHPYQKDAVARILFTPNTLLAHDVGAGKTYIMIAAGMELRRMGLSAKNLYVVPNNITDQWQAIFHSMYPSAEILCVNPASFTPSKRQEVLKRIKTEELDGIIMAYSCFEQIPLSYHYIVKNIRDEIRQIDEALRNRTIAQAGLKSRRKKLAEKLDDLAAERSNPENALFFDELGITRLFVDEAHNFKNVPVETKVSSVLGISRTGSKKCLDMLNKVRMIQKANHGGGVIMATGTPITNSITDAFIMQKYLQDGELTLLDLQSFDSWVGMFAEKTTEFEIDVDTQSYRLATRFAKFHNLTELTSLLSSIADFHQLDASAGIPETDGYNDVLIPKTPSFARYLKEISRRAEEVRTGKVSRTDDNMLKITTDGRKAALDLRLSDPNAVFSCSSKVYRCAETAANIYFKTEAIQGTQLIFCDTSTPKDGFNIYDELKYRLMIEGVPKEQIAFIHDAATEASRRRLFEKVRKGQLRILIGSTFKLGLGVNVQDHLIALHHLDVPWRPADMTQREGRILRQGNLNKHVRIYRYITEGSFDAYSWQLLETKQRFICDLLSGSLTDRNSSDIDSIVLNYAEVKALAVGNPLVKKRVEAANELSRYITLQRKLVETRLNLQKELEELPERKHRQSQLIRKCITDRKRYITWTQNNPEPSENKQKNALAEGRREIRTYLQHALNHNYYEPEERAVLGYKGFEIVLPAHMSPENPYILLTGKGRYFIEFGDSDKGFLTRIDNFLENLSAHLASLRSTLRQLEERETAIQKELTAKTDYADKIDAYRKLIHKMDKSLGVLQDE